MISFLLSACAKVSYVWEQGWGQMALQQKSLTVEEALQDPTLESSQKEKIQKIVQYKKFFFQYFSAKPNKTYDKVKILSQEAVSYAVTVSPFTEIKPLEECFPIVGCFPYLSFFKQADALEYQKKKQQEGYATYVRPVYAYSTLGYFTDPILSSFFFFNDEDLAILIFHELFHGLFFIKKEVDFNENLAEFFSQELLKEYLQDDVAKWQTFKEKQDKSQKINQTIVQLTHELQARYQEKKLSDAEAQEVLSSFLEQKFWPGLRTIYDEQKITDRNIFTQEWNNATFASFLVYEEHQDQLAKLKEKKKLSLKEFYSFIRQEYAQYKKNKGKFSSFKEYLFSL